MIVTNTHKYLKYEVPKQCYNKVSQRSAPFSKFRNNWYIRGFKVHWRLLPTGDFFHPTKPGVPSVLLFKVPVLLFKFDLLCQEAFPDFPQQGMFALRSFTTSAVTGWGGGCIFFSLLGCELLGGRDQALVLSVPQCRLHILASQQATEVLLALARVIQLSSPFYTFCFLHHSWCSPLISSHLCSPLCPASTCTSLLCPCIAL